MSFSGWIWVIACSAIVVVANVLLRLGIAASGVNLFANGLAGLPRDILGLAMQPMFCTAVFCYGLSMMMWVKLASEPLSVAYPVLASLTFVAISLAAVFVFKEAITIQKGLGIAVTLLGLTLISTS